MPSTNYPRRARAPSRNEDQLQSAIADLQRRIMPILNKYQDPELQNISKEFSKIEAMSCAEKRLTRSSTLAASNVAETHSHEMHSMHDERSSNISLRTRSASKSYNEVNNMDVDRLKLLESRKKLSRACQAQKINGRRPTGRRRTTIGPKAVVDAAESFSIERSSVPSGQMSGKLWTRRIS